jgi:hypothetical protein
MPRRFQFSLRALLVATLIVAVSCAVIASRIREKQRERELVRLIDDTFAAVFYDWQMTVPGKPRSAKPPGWKWCHSILGDDFFAKPTFVFCGDDVTDADLALLVKLWSIEDLCVGNPGWLGGSGSRKPINAHVTDAGLAHLKALRRLKSLSLVSVAVTDQGIAELQASLPGCKIHHYR